MTFLQQSFYRQGSWKILGLKNKIESLILETEGLGENIKNDPKRTNESSNPLGIRIFLLNSEDEIKLNKFSKEFAKVIMNSINKNQSNYMQSI